MTQDDVYRLIYQVQGQQEVGALTKAFEDESAVLKGLNAQLAATAAPSAGLVAAQAAAEAQALKTGAQLLAARESLRKYTREAEDAAEKSRRLQQGVQKLGYTLDDLQYVGEQGLRPILNNLMQINPILGIVALGVDQAIRHWDQLKEALGQVGEQKHRAALEDLTEDVKNLGDKADTSTAAFHRLIDAQDEIDQRKKDKAGVAGLEAKGTADQELVGKGVSEALARGGGGRVAEDTVFAAYRDANTLTQFNRGQERAQAKVDAEMARIAAIKAAMAAHPDKDGWVDKQGGLHEYKAEIQASEDRLAKGDFLYRNSFGKAGTEPLRVTLERETVATEKNARAAIDAHIQGARLGQGADVDFLLQMMDRGGAARETVEALGRARVAPQLKQLEADSKDAEAKADLAAKHMEELGPGREQLARGEKRAELDRRTAAEKAQHAAGQAHAHAVAAAAGAFDGALEGPAMFDLAGGMDPAKVRALLEAELQKSGRVPPEAIADAAGKLLEDARTKLAAKLMEAAAAGERHPEAAVRAGIARAAQGRAEHAADAHQVDALAAQMREGAAWRGVNLSPRQAHDAAARAVRDAGGNMERLQLTAIAALDDVVQAGVKLQQRLGRLEGRQNQAARRAHELRHRAQ